jgi:DNA-binding transcriptional LysR family regulator
MGVSQLIAALGARAFGVAQFAPGPKPRAGLGVAYVGESIVADDIASGRLVEVLTEWTPSYPGYCLYYPGRHHIAASLRAFVDLAHEIVSRNRAKAS